MKDFQSMTYFRIQYDFKKNPRQLWIYLYLGLRYMFYHNVRTFKYSISRVQFNHP